MLKIKNGRLYGGEADRKKTDRRRGENKVFLGLLCRAVTAAAAAHRPAAAAAAEFPNIKKLILEVKQRVAGCIYGECMYKVPAN